MLASSRDGSAPAKCKVPLSTKLHCQLDRSLLVLGVGYVSFSHPTPKRRARQRLGLACPSTPAHESAKDSELGYQPGKHHPQRYRHSRQKQRHIVVSGGFSLQVCGFRWSIYLRCGLPGGRNRSRRGPDRTPLTRPSPRDDIAPACYPAHRISSGKPWTSDPAKCQGLFRTSYPFLPKVTDRPRLPMFADFPPSHRRFSCHAHGGLMLSAPHARPSSRFCRRTSACHRGLTDSFMTAYR